MVIKKNLLLATVIAGALGMVASTSFASGPIILGSTTAPVVPNVAAASSGNTMQTKALSIYRQVRTFWLSRAIVR